MSEVKCRNELNYILNALPQLDSVFADIVNMTEEANTYPAELKDRDYTRAEARMVIVCAPIREEKNGGGGQAVTGPNKRQTGCRRWRSETAGDCRRL